MKLVFTFGTLICLVLCACKAEPELSDEKIRKPPAPASEITSTNSDSLITKSSSVSNDSIKRKGLDQLVDIQSLDPSIQVDLKYATTDNFMHQRLYFDIDKLYLQRDVAERLVKVQALLKKEHPDLSLLVYDGVRPLSVQWAMWKALDSIPVKDRVKFVSNPASGSIHNYGAAIDLTICKAASREALDMGAGYDDIREIAYPRKEAHYLQTGELSADHVNNRKLLRRVMASQGFTNIPTEWWHFNACSRAAAKKKYAVLQ